MCLRARKTKHYAASVYTSSAITLGPCCVRFEIPLHAVSKT